MKNSKYFRKLKTGPDDAGRRLDRVLRKALPDHSLSLIHRLLRQKKALLDGKPASPGDRVPPGAVIQLVIHAKHRTRTGERVDEQTRHGVGQINAAVTDKPKRPHSSYPPILWRGAGIIVFNKPPGLATHGEDSLDTLVKAWLDGKLPPSLSFKPGPLHRLDKPTSGAVAFSETIEGARLFSRLLRERKVIKTYLAIVEGRMTGDAIWHDDLARDSKAGKTFAGVGMDGAKNALTSVKALASSRPGRHGSYTLMGARIITGRTHQIRAQAAAHGYPLAGDRKYGGHSFPGGFSLHAWMLDLGGRIPGFPQPLVAPLPSPFQLRIATLFGTDSW